MPSEPRIDPERLNRYTLKIEENLQDLREILQTPDEEILSSSRDIKALKYCLIEIAEATANILQHILARKWGKVVDSYLGLIDESINKEVMDKELLARLKFFFRFRNYLVHRYWEVDDRILLENTRRGLEDMEALVEETRKWTGKAR